MFVAAYDDRLVVPDYFMPFIRNTTRFCDLHLITPAKNLWRSTKPSSGALKFRFQVIDPSDLPKYQRIKQLFDDLFINYSTNSDAFERACFHRWFALNASTTTLRSDDYICLLDTDFLLGMSPSNILSQCLSKATNRNIQFIAEWNGEEPIAIGPEISIMTKSYLYGFCKYLLTTYYSPTMRSQLVGEYFDRIGNGLSGGICDMRALAAYARLHYKDVWNLRNLDEPQILENFTSFLNTEIGNTDNWKISLQSGIQTLQVANASKKLIGIHFQGGIKPFMHLACGENCEITRSTYAEYLTRKKTFTRRIASKMKRVINPLLTFALK